MQGRPVQLRSSELDGREGKGGEHHPREAAIAGRLIPKPKGNPGDAQSAGTCQVVAVGENEARQVRAKGVVWVDCNCKARRSLRWLAGVATPEAISRRSNDSLARLCALALVSGACRAWTISWRCWAVSLGLKSLSTGTFCPSRDSQAAIN